MRRSNRLILAILIVVLALSLSSCLPGDGKNTAAGPAGFWTGIWHGWVAPVSLIVGIFDKDIRIYEPQNKGWSYDAGFYVAIIAGFGGIALTRSRRKY